MTTKTLPSAHPRRQRLDAEDDAVDVHGEDAAIVVDRAVALREHAGVQAYDVGGLDVEPGLRVGHVEAVDEVEAAHLGAFGLERGNDRAPDSAGRAVTRAVSGNKNDLPGRLAGGDQLLRLVHLLERELGADHGPEGAAAPQRQQFSDLLLHEVRPEAHQPAEVEPEHADVAADEPCRVDRLPRAAGEADPDRGAERAERLEALREDRPTHRVERHVDVVELADLLVGDRAVAPSSACQLDLLLEPLRR